MQKFLEEGKRRKIQDCELLKYQPTHSVCEIEAVSMHQLVCKFKEKCVEEFLKKVEISASVIKK